MTKGELRKARKAARARGERLTGELALPSDRGPEPFEVSSDTPRGRRALERWARRYDELNGAPEGEWDR